MLRSLYVKYQLAVMMWMIKGYQCEIETYMQHKSWQHGGLCVEQPESAKINKE